MMSKMKQCWKKVLVAMLVWVLVFLALLSYFLDTHADETLTSAGSVLSQHPDTRRLTSLQASHHQHAIPDSRPDRSLNFGPTYHRIKPELGPSATPEPIVEVNRSPDNDPYLTYSSQEANRQDYLDPQSLAAWSSFGTENVDSYSDPAFRSRERTTQIKDHLNRVDATYHHDGEEEENDDEMENIQTAKADRSKIRAAKLDEYYSYKSESLMQGLWKGRVSFSMLSPRLQRAFKAYMNTNKHDVIYEGHRTTSLTAKQLLCQMKAQAKLRTVDGMEEPFRSLGWMDIVPSLPLEQLGKGLKNNFKSCAVVTSAGAILRSRLGKEIDSHDAVLRFNAAPTEGYERDVGNKTTIRIINSQILTNPSHQFNTSSMFKDVALVAWDPAPYAIDLYKWYANPDYNLFVPYVDHRLSHPDQLSYILHPSYVWKLWDLIQSNTQENIQPNPPSSGFIGILLMMALCEEVHVYEYIPSLRQTDLCHYHENYYDAACTLGAYHPLLYEKSLIQRVNSGPESDLRMKGCATLPGFSTIDCDV
uniref:Beta-galactoside alpha-2,6-sialyltransferase 2 n=1 Tax=Nothobranchius furzeri TaxID=105023 RepID=A0A1A8U873_NOTFU